MVRHCSLHLGPVQLMMMIVMRVSSAEPGTVQASQAGMLHDLGVSLAVNQLAILRMINRTNCSPG